MLMESFKINETVRVKDTGQTGKIVGFENGKWKVEGVSQLLETSQIEHTQMLFG